MAHPQLAQFALSTDTGRELFLDVLLPALEQRSELARSIGGAFGFVIGEEQWVIDLAAVRVVGGTDRAAVEERGDLELVLSLSKDDLRGVLRGQAGLKLGVVSGDLARLPRLLRALGVVA